MDRGRYLEGVGALIRKSALAMLGCSVFGSRRLAVPPASHQFSSDEDQGTIYVTVRLPDAASAERADVATHQAEDIISRIPGVAARYFGRPRHLHPHFQLECRHRDYAAENRGRSHTPELEFRGIIANLQRSSRGYRKPSPMLSVSPPSRG